ncbi:electron transfer flavoprotein subunit alpha/FixB family protein, partial [Azotobacter beijerinckii]|nr:electron transfer flavoprotein subunit alpha/FixB family protein [Azotobacter beijerinckii]
MAILVIAEHDNRTLKGATLNTLGAAALLGGEVHLLVAGFSCGAVAAQAAAIPGVSKVLVADAAVYEHQLAENLARLVAALGKTYSHLLAPAGSAGKNLMPRVAALLDVAQLSDIVGVVSPNTFRRPIYAGNAIATVQSLDPVVVATVRASAFDPVPAEG